MRQILCILFLLGGYAFAGTCGNGYNFEKKFTIPSYQVPNTDQSNFPVYIAFNGVGFGDILLSDLKTVANGGQIQNTANNSVSVSGPADLVFCDAASAGNSLSYEVARYSATTGAMEAYVMMPTLSHTTPTQFWMFYGNASVSTTQQDLSLWTTAGYSQVCHMSDGTTLNPNCSTGGTGSLVNTPTATTGTMDGGGAFVATSSQRINTGVINNFTTTVTSEVWYQSSLAGSNISVYDTADSTNGVLLREGAGGSSKIPFFLILNGGSSKSLTSTFNPGNSWMHVVGTFSSGTMNIYTNGINSNNASAGTATSAGTSTGNTNIGANSAGAAFFTGSIDEARLSSSVRSADWVKTTYNNEASPSAFAWMSDVTVMTGPRVIQYATCRGTSPITCTFPNNVVSGNLIGASISSNSAGTTCTVPASNFSDTRSSTFTIAASANSGGLNQAATCIGFAPLVSSGAETITLTYGSVAYGEIVEVAGVSSPSLDATNGAVSSSSASLGTGSATASTSNSIILCATAQTGAGSPGISTTFSPSSSFAINNVNSTATDGASLLVQFTGSGSKSCTFTYNSAGTEQAASIGIIKYTPFTAHKIRPAIMY